MPRHDYRHAACGQILREVYRPTSERASDRPPLCPTCGVPMEWIPQVGRMDAASGATFKAFDHDVAMPDGSIKTLHIDSLHTLRKVERESEQAYRNGEGQPLVWRDYSQDKGNTYNSVFGPDPGTVAREEIAKSRRDVAERLRSGRSAEDPGHDYGSGVSDATTSALLED